MYQTKRLIVIFLIVICALTCGALISLFFIDRSHLVITNARDIPLELNSTFVDVAQQVEPSVVNISTVIQPSNRGANESVFPFEMQEQARRGIGSGVIIDNSGYVLTNHHVISGVDRIKVKLYDGSEYPGKIIGSDQEADLAVIKIEPHTQLRAARLGDSERVQVGDWVLAIGSPFGLDQTVTAGIISAKGREANDLNGRPSFQHLLQTDAAINRGNSGGPLINLSGEVIGINAAIATTTGDYNGVCFAIPSNEALSIYQQLKQSGRVVRGFLGVITDPVTPQIAKVYGLPMARGTIVSIVTETYQLDGRELPTPASQAGLQLGDIITEYRGELVRNNLDLIRRVAATSVGTEAPIKIIRNGQEMLLRTVIGRRPFQNSSESKVLNSAQTIAENSQSLGIDVANLPAVLTRNLTSGGVSGVLVVQVEPGSVADDAELRREDIIEKVNRIPVNTALQFRRSIDRIASGESIVLQVYRRRSSAPRRFISLNKP